MVDKTAEGAQPAAPARPPALKLLTPKMMRGLEGFFYEEKELGLVRLEMTEKGSS